jgi:DsbC/DsbD-like thiol-disulfide interchange protein
MKKGYRAGCPFGNETYHRMFHFTTSSNTDGPNPANDRTMIAIPLPPIFVAVLLMAAAAVTDGAHAGSAGWAEAAHSAVRLIAAPAPDPEAAERQAGVELRLDPGWKTYWRYPGDSGIPPRFDFSGSDNVDAVTIAWPAPNRLVDETGVTIGYKGAVVFPLAVRLLDPAKPATLRLKLEYGVCEKLCIPAEAEATLDLTAPAAAAKHVPKKAALGAPGPLAVTRLARTAPDQAAVEVRAPAGEHVALFVEGPGPDWALPVPEPATAGADGIARFAFTLDGLPPGADPTGAKLTLTATAAGHAVEVSAPLD